jgi:hypothetical protein
MNRDWYEEVWKVSFETQNGRKPNHQEKIAFRVGFVAGVTFVEEKEE